MKNAYTLITDTNKVSLKILAPNLQIEAIIEAACSPTSC
jgi:hypothetical protein